MSKTSIAAIPYNKPFLTGKEQKYIQQVLEGSTFSGNNAFTKLCQAFFEKKYNFKQCFLTHSCSSALEMAAILCDFQPGDEVIVPSYGYVTTASAFQGKGAKLIFADSEKDRPHICPDSIKDCITPNTKALVIIHYAGAGCNMKEISEIAATHNILLIEDCAHAINASYRGQYLGSFGQLSTFSFHETKNIHCGEGGLLVVNDNSLAKNAEKVWQEGTNRSDFENNLTDKYEWVSQGSSYQPNELTAAFLYGQLDSIDQISMERLSKWNTYYENLLPLEKNGMLQLPHLNEKGHNAHIFYIELANKYIRDALLLFMNDRGIKSVFHYLPLHLSPYWLESHDPKSLLNSEDWSNRILRLPLYQTLSKDEQEYIVQVISDFLTHKV